MRTKIVSNNEITQQHILDIRKMFTEEAITINKSSFLNKLLEDVEKNYSKENNSIPIIFNAIHINRIHSALMELNGINNKHNYLKDLLKGNLDFHENKESHAKNILFELEVAVKLKPLNCNIYLQEPDIVIETKETKIAIACKKIVSEKNLKKLISKASKQIKKQNLDFAIIAINIDNLLPNNQILKAKNSEEASDILHNSIKIFIEKHHRHLNRKLGVHNVLGIYITASIITDLTDEIPRFNNHSQTVLFTINNPRKEEKQVLDLFRTLI